MNTIETTITLIIQFLMLMIALNSEKRVKNIENRNYQNELVINMPRININFNNSEFIEVTDRDILKNDGKEFLKHHIWFENLGNTPAENIIAKFSFVDPNGKKVFSKKDYEGNQFENITTNRMMKNKIISYPFYVQMASSRKIMLTYHDANFPLSEAFISNGNKSRVITDAIDRMMNMYILNLMFESKVKVPFDKKDYNYNLPRIKIELSYYDIYGNLISATQEMRFDFHMEIINEENETYQTLLKYRFVTSKYKISFDPLDS